MIFVYKLLYIIYSNIFIGTLQDTRVSTEHQKLTIKVYPCDVYNND